MNIKNLVKNIDYKGLALRHCEKAAIAIVTLLLVLYLWSGVKKSMSASDVSPEKISQLADKLTKSIQNSEWNEEGGQVKNPNFKDEIEKLVGGVPASSFALSQVFFHFVDFGDILRQKPDILSPYHPLVIADRGAVSLYKLDSKGEFEEEEVVVRVASTKPKEDKPKEKSKTTTKGPQAKAGGRGGMMGMRGAGMGMDMGSMGMGSMGYPGGMGMGGDMMGEFGGRGMMGMGAGGQGAGAGPGEDMVSNLASSQQRRSAGNIRRSSGRKGEDLRFDDTEERGPTGSAEAPAKTPAAPQKKKIRREEIKGIRWAMVTALFPHKEQVKKFEEALHTSNDPPAYKMVKVERRELLSDGSFSEWAPLDMVKGAEIKKRMPERWVPEDAVMMAARAVFPGLMMRLPQLEVGDWIRYVRREAHNAAVKLSASGLAGGAGEGGEGMSQDELQASANEALFGTGGAGGGGVGAGAAGSMGMMSRGMGAATGSMGMGGRGMGSGAGMGAGMASLGMEGTLGAAGYSGGMGRQNVTRTTQAQQTPQAVAAQKSNAEIVQIRFVDYTVEPEHTYQYRLKVVVENPNYKRFDVISEDLAKDETLTSEDWSDPTAPVYVPGDTEFYVLERTRSRDEAKIQVHTWLADMGDWQYYDFTVKPGDPIGARVREYQLVNWDDKIQKTEFDFSTHDLLLDVTGGDKPFVFEVDGVQFNYTEKLPTEIFVIDRLGDLAMRNEDFDKHNVDRVEREATIKKVREEAKSKDDKDKGKPGSKAESGTKDDFDDRLPRSRGTQ